MITKLSTYITKNTIPYKNLAIEEYLTMHVQPGECILFLWQNRHTVVIGKNQNCWKECKVKELEADNGNLVRRLSGGGAVYHDLGNLNFTFCVRKEDYDVDRQLAVIIEAARMFGIHAEKTGRNDVTVEGKKFSGNAFYDSNGFCYHHGTLLLSVDKENMSKYLNVSKEKLQTKGVSSVRSRVANLQEFNPDVNVERMEENLIAAFGKVYGLKTEEIPEERFDCEAIEKGEERFASWEWKYGRKIPFEHEISKRFGWGGIDLQFHVDKGVVQSVNAYSDGMEYSLVDLLPGAWQGKRYEVEELSKALELLPEVSETEHQMKQDISALLQENL